MRRFWNNNRPGIAALCLLSSLFLSGFIFYAPKLINADEPFIDLVGGVSVIPADSGSTPADVPVTTSPAPTPVDPVDPVDTTPTPSVGSGGGGGGCNSGLGLLALAVLALLKRSH